MQIKLKQTLKNLEKTQVQLIQSEKLASLGELVASVAHELNTPIGSSITLISFLDKQIKDLKDKIGSDILSKNELNDFISRFEMSNMTIAKALKQASDMINSFKTVAINQSELELRKFNVLSYIEDVLVMIHSLTKMSNVEIKIVCDRDLIIYSYPRILSRIMTELITNSINHGFEGKAGGIIKITISSTSNQLEIFFSDNGNGISEKMKPHIFEPFSGSKKFTGSIGLGLHSVHNMVTQILKGDIVLDNSHEGTTFIIDFNIKETD